MMNLELVIHCWKYTRLLTYQLSSLMLFVPKKVQLLATVFLTQEDTDTVEAVRFFAGRSLSPNVVIRPWTQPREELLRRAIGRNLAALETTSDWIWFTDCDYLFRENCLDSLPALLEKVDGPLAFPRSVRSNITRLDGDRAISRVIECDIYDIDEDDFAPKKMSRAIGGIQIARSNVVRQTGYLNKSRRLRPHHGETFSRFSEDQAFRQQLQTKGEAIELPGIYRIRHSVAGYETADAEL